MTAERAMQDVITLRDRELPVWPREQRVEMLAAPNVAVADFGDRDLYHASLIAVILEMERDPRYRDWIFQGGCGTKVRDPHLWGRPEADLIHARAMRFASLALGVENVVVDDCWANVYRKGNYCMPHSHLRAAASLVYFLDPGDVDTEDPGAGRFYFCDPRIPFCCDFEDGRVTRLFMPDMYAGSLLIFPAQFVHAVNPYTGTRPRITLSWNIGASALPGDRSDGWSKRETASLDPVR
jgi:hypothetical protein